MSVELQPREVQLLTTTAASTQLCFNKAHFNRPDFSVERFINLTRRRATLDVIHNDLRSYLRQLQSSMIELINDDYADFVNLSSSLAVLKDGIDKICSCSGASWSSFQFSTSDIQKAAETVQLKCSELAANRSAQILIRNKISLLVSISRLLHSLENRTTALSSWLPKLISLVVEVEIWYGRVPESKLPPKAISRRQECYSRIKKILIEELIADMSAGFNNFSNILQLLSLIMRDNVAILKVASGVVALQISVEDASDKDNLLRDLFSKILKLREQWLEILEQQSQLNSKTELFIDSVLLQYCLIFLDEKFSSVFVPCDTSLFHKCYNITIQFVLKWPSCHKSMEIHDLLKTLLSRFNTVVYFKMHTQQIQQNIKKQINVEEFSFMEPKDAPEFGCRCPISSTILRAISTLFGDDNVFLPSLVDKFWDFMLKMLISYSEWVKNSYMHFNNLNKENGKNSGGLDTKPWLNAVVLSCDLTIFCAKFLVLCDEVVWRRFIDLQVNDLTSMKSCVTIFVNEMEKLKVNIADSIIQLLLFKATQEILAVSDIPKQYRWTKKPSPTSCSNYMHATIAICEEFLLETSKFDWNTPDRDKILKHVVEQLVSVFCDQAEQVLQSVEQTGSSLQRFKRKMQQQRTDATPDADTDEAKIRAQLLLDAQFMGQYTTKCGVDTVSLTAIQQRIQTEFS